MSGRLGNYKKQVQPARRTETAVDACALRACFHGTLTPLRGHSAVTVRL